MRKTILVNQQQNPEVNGQNMPTNRGKKDPTQTKKSNTKNGKVKTRSSVKDFRELGDYLTGYPKNVLVNSNNNNHLYNDTDEKNYRSINPNAPTNACLNQNNNDKAQQSSIRGSQRAISSNQKTCGFATVDGEVRT